MPSPALLCDIGNVLVHFDFNRAAERFAIHCPLAAAEVLRVLDPLKGPLESGHLDGSSFVQHGMEMLRFIGTEAEFRHIWCDIFSLNPPMEQTLASLAQRVPMHLLSNTSDLHKDFLLSEFPIFTHFTDGVFSFSARSMKPDAEIFRIAIAQLDLEPARTFYIDDLMPNIETARRLGFRTFHYADDRHAALDAELHAWLADL